MPTYSASTAATASFATLAAARVALAARSLAVTTFATIAAANVTFTARASATAQFIGDVNGIKNHQYSAQSVAPFTFDGNAANGGRTVNAEADATWSMVATGSVCSAGLGLQVNDAIQSIYSVWGVACHSDSCESDIGEEAVNCLNAAFQRLHSNGKIEAFINRGKRSIELTALDAKAFTYGIPVGTDVQSLSAPVTLRTATEGSKTVEVLTYENGGNGGTTTITFTNSNVASVTATGADATELVEGLRDVLLANPSFIARYTVAYDEIGLTLTFTALENGDSEIVATSGSLFSIQRAPGEDDTTTALRTLRPLGNAAALQSFNMGYLDTALTTHQQPLAYLVEQISDPTTARLVNGREAAANELVIHLAPRDPSTSAVAEVDALCFLEYDVVLKPQRFSCQTPWARLPVPSLYAETLLLPLAKFYACSSRFFKGNAELKESITQQAGDVLSLLGDVNPLPKEVAK